MSHFCAVSQHQRLKPFLIPMGGNETPPALVASGPSRQFLIPMGGNEGYGTYIGIHQGIRFLIPMGGNEVAFTEPSTPVNEGS